MLPQMKCCVDDDNNDKDDVVDDTMLHYVCWFQLVTDDQMRPQPNAIESIGKRGTRRDATTTQIGLLMPKVGVIFSWIVCRPAVIQFN